MPGPGEVGVQFHDGTPFTARHVEWSYKLTMKPEAEGAGFLMNAARLTELKGAQAFIDGTSEDIEGLTVVDDHTVVFETAVPNGNFFETVGRVYILPEHLFRDKSWVEVLTTDWMSPDVRVGTGPFKLEEFVEGNYTSFARNDNYWAGKPYLDRYVVRFFDESMKPEQLPSKKGKWIWWNSSPPRRSTSLPRIPRAMSSCVERR